MRLAFCLFKYFPFGGLQRDFLRVATICRERGHDITVFTQTWQGDIPPGWQINVVPLRSISSHGKCWEFAHVTAVRLDEGDFDVVVGFNKMPGLDIYFAADPCYQHRMREKYGIGYALHPRYRTFVALEEAVFSTQVKTEILLLSAPEQEVFRRYYQTPPERFHLLPPGISKDRVAPANAAELRAEFRRKYALDADENLVLMIGSGFKRKGLDRALRALASLPTGLLAKTHLMVVGEDDPRPYFRMAKRLGVDKQVTMLGGRNDVPHFLLGADLLFHPAYSEAAGMVLLEAMASGLSVLVTDVCGYAFHVARARAGQVIPSPFVQEDLNRRLREMLTSAARQTWRVNGLTYAQNTDLYSMPSMAADIIEAKARNKKIAPFP